MQMKRSFETNQGTVKIPFLSSAQIPFPTLRFTKPSWRLWLSPVFEMELEQISCRLQGLGNVSWYYEYISTTCVCCSTCCWEVSWQEGGGRGWEKTEEKDDFRVWYISVLTEMPACCAGDSLICPIHPPLDHRFTVLYGCQVCWTPNTSLFYGWKANL